MSTGGRRQMLRDLVALTRLLQRGQCHALAPDNVSGATNARSDSSKLRKRCRMPSAPLCSTGCRTDEAQINHKLCQTL